MKLFVIATSVLCFTGCQDQRVTDLEKRVSGLEQSVKQLEAVDDHLARRGKLGAGVLRPRMTMSEVEGLFGQPDRTEVIDGKIDGKYEHPKQIIWTYTRYKITESGEQYSQPGHIRFIPVRFFEKESQADETARKYGEQSDVFRVCSFRGSFPINKKDWEANDAPFGLLDGFPIKELKK